MTKQSWADIADENELHANTCVVIIIADQGRIVGTTVLNANNTWRDVCKFGRPPPTVQLDAELCTTSQASDAITHGTDVCAIIVNK